MTKPPPDAVLHPHPARETPRSTTSRPKRVGALGSVGLAMGLTVANSALGQGTGGRLPEPRSGPEVAAWLENSGISGDAMGAVWSAHEDYLATVDRVRDGEIEAWLIRYPEAAFGPPAADAVEALDRAARQASEHRRLYERLANVEDNFWAEVAIAAGLDDATLQSLRARAIRERALDLQSRRRFLGGTDPLDVAGLIERLDATEAEAALVRERLVDHDRLLSAALAEAVEAQFESAVRRAERRLAREDSRQDRQAALQEEIAAAEEEGREPDLSQIAGLVSQLMIDGLEIGGSGSKETRALRDQQLASLEMLRGVLTDERLAFLLARLGHGGGDPLGHMFRTSIDEMIESRAIDAKTAEAVDAIRKSYYQERVTLALELARMGDAGTGIRMSVVGPDGEQRRMETDEDRRVDLRMRLAAELPARVRSQLKGLIELPALEAQRDAIAIGRGGAIDLGGTAGGMVFQGEAGEGIAFATTAVVATLEIDDIELGDAMVVGEPIVMNIEFGDGANFVIGDVSPPAPPLRAMSRERLATMLEDVGISEDLAIVAEQLRLDAAAVFDAALREFEAAQQQRRENADRNTEVPGAPIELLGPRAEMDLLDTVFRRCLVAEGEMFDAIESLVDAESIGRLAMWRDLREGELFAQVSGLRGGSFDPDLAAPQPPWIGAWPRLDFVGLVLDTVPAALGDVETRESIADHARRYRRAVEAHWMSMQALVPEARAARSELFGGLRGGGADPVAAAADIESRNARVEATTSKLEQSRSRLGQMIRDDLLRLEPSLSDDDRRAVHVAVRRAVWPQAVPRMPGIAAIDAATGVLMDDAARTAELKAIENRYLAESDRLFSMLETIERPPARREVSANAMEFSPEQMGRWQSLSGRLRFRHGELDFETVRRIRDLVGPRNANRIVWPRTGPPPAEVIEFFGG